MDDGTFRLRDDATSNGATAHPPVPSRLTLDLLRPPGVVRLLGSPLFPLGLQVLTLLALAALVANAWGLGLDLEPDQLQTFRKTNLTTLAVWGLWWPGMILVALTLGRAWCTICPMELVARLSHRLARRHWRGLALPSWARAAWPALVLYLLLQALVASAAIHRLPHYTALMLLALPLLALAAGALLRHPRGFCVALCPAGPLLSVYGRLGLMQLDRRDDATCERCVGRECMSAQTRDQLDRRSCPSLIRPFARAQGDACVLCFQCAKTCPHDNIGFGVPRAHSALRRPTHLAPVELAFVVIVSGFVTYELTGELPTLARWFSVVPEALAATPLPLSLRSWQAVWYLAIFPATLWSLVALATKLLWPRQPLKVSMGSAISGAIAVVAAAHAAKALAKLSDWAGFLPLALTEPGGEHTLAAIETHSLLAPGPLVTLPAVGAVALVAMALLLWHRRSRHDLASVESRGPTRLGTVAALTLFIPILVCWNLSIQLF